MGLVKRYQKKKDENNKERNLVNWKLGHVIYNDLAQN